MTTNPQKNAPLPSVTPLPSDLVLIRSELKELKDEILKSRKQVFRQSVFGTMFAIGFLFVTFALINSAFNNAFRTDPNSDRLNSQIDEQSRKIHEYRCEHYREITQDCN